MLARRKRRIITILRNFFRLDHHPTALTFPHINVSVPALLDDNQVIAVVLKMCSSDLKKFLDIMDMWIAQHWKVYLDTVEIPINGQKHRFDARFFIPVLAAFYVAGEVPAVWVSAKEIPYPAIITGRELDFAVLIAPLVC